jgi:hypothetical protein
MSSLILASTTGYAIADCKSDQSKSWICKGAKAWKTGYLVSSDRLLELLDLEELWPTVKKEREEFRDLSDKLQKERGEYQTQRDELRELLNASINLRDEYRGQRDRMEQELELVEKDLEDALMRNAELETRYAGWEVGFISGGTAIVGIGLGILVGAFAL